MAKKVTVIVTCVVVLLLIMPWAVGAAEVVGSGSAGSGTTWTLDAEGTLTVSGSGAVTQKFTDTAIKKIVIEDGISSISEGVFSGCTGLSEVTVNANLINYIFFLENRYTRYSSTSGPFDYSLYYNGGRNNNDNNFAKSIFGDCRFNVRKITFGDQVRKIGAYAFVGCTGLEEVVFGKNLRSIYQDAFRGCTALKNVSIPDSVTSIAERAFSGCTEIEELSIGNSVTSIANSAFSNCIGIKKLTLGNRLTTIGGSAFLGCSGISEMELPESLLTIESDAFADCISLKSLTIRTRIGDLLCGIRRRMGRVRRTMPDR